MSKKEEEDVDDGKNTPFDEDYKRQLVRRSKRDNTNHDNNNDYDDYESTDEDDMIDCDDDSTKIRKEACALKSPVQARQQQHQHNSSNNNSDSKGKTTRAATTITTTTKEKENKEKEDSESLLTKFVVCGNLFEVKKKYVPIKPIGKGAYGIVCSAKDEKLNTKVAIKKITNAFENVVDAKRTLREIKLLRHLKHENVVPITDCMLPTKEEEFVFNDVYVMYELMDTDLHQIIRSDQPLTDDHCQYFIYQLLRGLKYIHSADVLHRDLKPSNLLLNANCDLKICDFGLARTNTQDKNRDFMTEYVVTRWYRAPELLLSCAEYSVAIDVWSCGCILAELLGRKPLFPGKDYVHQLNLITKIIGTPDEQDLYFVTSDKARRYLRQLPYAKPTDFKRLYPEANALACDLIQKMLAFNPEKRIDVEQCLKHPYLASLHDMNDEPVSTKPFTFAFEQNNNNNNNNGGGGGGSNEMTEETVRKLIFQELKELDDEINNTNNSNDDLESELNGLRVV